MDASQTACLLQVGSGRFNPLSGELTRDGRNSKLRPRTAALLAHLLRHTDRVVTKDELMQAVWPDVVVTEDSLVQCVKEIRQALGDGGRDWIRTVPRQGYIFVGNFEGGALAAQATTSPRPPWKRYAALAVLVGGLATALLFFAWRSDSPQTRLSIAVMPLVNMTGDPAHDLTADDMTEALTDALARTSGTEVIASATAFTFKGRPVDARDIGASLDVRYVLHGSLRMEAATPVLAMRLVDAGNAVQLWSHEFRSAAVGELRELVASRVAGTLGVEVIRVGRRGADEGGVASRGVELLDGARKTLRRTLVSAEELASLEQAARSLHERSVRRGGSMADAWAMVAGSLLTNVRLSGMRDTLLRRAEVAVLRAIELGPDNDAAVLAYGLLIYEQGHMAEALAAFERVIELNPNNVQGHGWRGAALIMLGRAGESLTPIDQALRLSPRDARVPVWQLFAGVAHLHLGQDAMAIEWLTRSMRPQSPGDASVGRFASLFLASAFANAGRIDEARAEMARFQQASPGFTLSHFRAREPSKVPAFLQQRERIYDGLRRAGIPLHAEEAHRDPARASVGTWVGTWHGQKYQGSLEMVIEGTKGDSISGKIRGTNTPPSCSDAWLPWDGVAKNTQVFAAYRQAGRCGKVELNYSLDATGTVMTGSMTSEWPSHGTFRVTKQAGPIAGSAAGVSTRPDARN